VNDPGYYTSVAVPVWQDDEWRHRQFDGGPVATLGEALGLYAHIVHQLELKDVVDRDDSPKWHKWQIFAVDEDGTKRELTKVEWAGLVAELEQLDGGRVTLEPFD
jgi:hypothetical protein